MCGNLPSSAITYICQVVFLGLICITAFVGIFVNPQNQAYFMSIVGTCIGVMVPSPQLKLSPIVPNSVSEPIEPSAPANSPASVPLKQ